MKHSLQCSHCSKAIEREDYQIARNTTGLWFCSYDCQKAYHTSRATAPELTCPVCGKQFIVKPYRVKPGKQLACSLECRQVLLGWGSKLLNCEWCGQEFRRRNAQVNGHNFCSRHCMGQWQSEHVTGEQSPSWRGGWQPYYGKDWSKQNRQARKRDDHTCQGCGVHQNEITYTLEVHHKKPVRLFDNPNDANSLDNLVTLCRPCHVKMDVYARWLFDQNRRNSKPVHPLQSDSAIARVYFDTKTAPP